MWNQYPAYGYPPPTAPAVPAYQPQPAPTPAADPGWIMAQTIKQVEQISVQPGQKAWIMVQSEPIFALRHADQMGLITTDYYRFEKIDPAVPAETEYLTRKEFQAYLDSLKEGNE